MLLKIQNINLDFRVIRGKQQNNALWFIVSHCII